MKFTKIIGKCDPKLVLEAQKRLSAILTELAMGYEVKNLGTKLGGDIFLYQLMSQLNHICDARSIEFEEEYKKILQSFDEHLLSEGEKFLVIQELKSRLGAKLVYTAATNGKSVFWSPKFVVERSKIGLRLVVGHEGGHIIYMHPSRRGLRNRALWNITVDFKVNFNLIEDLRLRKCYDPEEIFKKELGDFINLTEYSLFLKDPFNPPDKLATWNPSNSIKQMLNPGYIDAGNTQKSFYYAEPKLSGEMLKPENIYQFLLDQIPKCQTCGKIGVWKKPDEYQKLENQLKEKIQDEH